MPVIREYHQQVSAPGPTNQPAFSADQFGAAEGRALGVAGEALMKTGDVVAKRLNQENTADVTAKMAKTHADLAIELQNTIRTAEPGDKKAFEDFEKRADEAIGKVGDDATTEGARTFFTEASAKVKGSLAQTSASGQAELAGIKAVNDYTTTLNSLSSAALADPSSIQLQRDLHRQALSGLVSTGQLPREKAIELQRRGDTEITKSTVRGWINLNPNYAKEKLKSGSFDADLGADGKVQLFGEADQAIRAKEIEDERLQRQQEKIKKQAEQRTQNGFLQNMVDGKLSTKDILQSNLEAFGSGSKEQFLQMLKAHNERKIETDPQVMVSLFQRIHLPDGDEHKLTDENELNQAVIAGHLSITDLNRLRDEMQGKNTQSGQIEADMKKQVLEIARGKLTKSNPLMGIKDPAGDEQMAKFMSYFLDEYKSQRAQGVPASDLLNPSSPKYLGQMLGNYTRTSQQIMRDMVPKRSQPEGSGLAVSPNQQGASAAPVYRAPVAPKASPRKPGEAPADYLKRIKGGG